MNGSCESSQPTLCGCCQGVTSETPEPIFNRPGLSAISYRVGTHNTFLASLLAVLTSSIIPPWAPLSTAENADPSLAGFNPAVALSGLRTRDASDFSIALLDAWATSLDILSFYQERIANEVYLRTAVDAASVFDLAQLVGYKPSPGVAASAFLAFTLNNAPGSPDDVLIPAGSRVQSVPGPGQQPQVFETSGDLTAVIEQNAIPPQTTVPWGLSANQTSIWLQGTSNNINVGDAILFVNQALHQAAQATSESASSAAAAGITPADFHFVTAVTVDSTAGNTLIQWDQPLNWPTSGDNTASVYVFRKKAALFGSQAPDPRSFSTTNNGLASVPGWPGGTTASADWSWLFAPGSLQLNLDGSYPGLAPPASGEPLWLALSCPAPPLIPLVPPTLVAIYQITAAVDTNPTAYTLTSKVTQLTLANGVSPEIVQLAELQGDTPAQVATIQQPLSPAVASLLLGYIVSQTRSASAYIQSNLLTPADSPYIAWSYDGVYTRQSGLLKPVEGSELEIVTGEQLSNGQPVAISGQRLRLQVAATFSPSSDSAAGFVPDGATGSLPLAPGQIFLVDAFPPTPASGITDMLWSVITTDGVAGTLEINTANVLLIPADKNDPVVGEAVTINSQPDVNGPIVTLSLTPALARIYDRSAVTVNANVVVATNGETQYDILGNGDGTNAALQFQLKQSPLTYVSSSLDNGAVSTLQVWVNNLQWHEVDNFLDSAPTDRVFITEAGSTGTVTVQFGDGQEGSRTPTGQMNIRAVYRKGIGAAGNVQIGQLSQPLDRPQGLKSVTNPDPGTGGADPDTADDARASAPLNVLTLGRVVSLEDYQNYALAFAGIEKALATWTWSGRQRSVFLTVAGANGAAFQADDLTITNLLAAFQNKGNRYVPVSVASPSYNLVFFEVGANIQVDTTDYDSTQVLAQVWQSLSTSFSFQQRQLGQGVAQSEIIAVIQQIPGVIAVELTIFNRQGAPTPATLPAVLLAASPVAGQQGTPAGAELLLLDTASQGNLGTTS